MGRAVLTAIFGAAALCGMLGAAPVAVTLNEKPLPATAIVRNGRVLLPFRAIFSALHASVGYDATHREVHAQRGGDHVFIKIGTHNSVIVADRLFVPVRYISESFGGKVSYDAVDRIVFITDSRAVFKVAQAPRAITPDAPSVTATFSPRPIVYATPDPDAPPAFAQALNFYIPNDQYAYSPGEPLNFMLTAPPNGTAYLQLCGYGRIAFINPLGSSQYFLHLTVPNRLAGHSCTATAYFVGPLGARQAVTLPYTLAFAQIATPAPSPTPTPEPTATPTPRPTATPARATEPVFRRPQSTATPKPKMVRPVGKPTP